MFCWSSLSYCQIETLKTYTFENVDSLIASNPKPVLIFFHTEWCKYCNLMTQTTFKNEQIINTLNQSFYFVSFNPESQKTVTFAGKAFKFIPKGNKSGIHEIAIELATIDGKINYPSICILSEMYEIVFQYNQYLSANDLIKVVNSTLENQ
jgi:thioredoxin-related protein